MTKPRYRFNESAIIRYGVLVRKPIAPFCQQPMATCPRRTAILTPAVGRSFGNALDLNQGGIERSTTTEVGESVRGQHINVETGFGQLCPTQLRPDDAGCHRAVNPCLQENLASLVVDTDTVAIGYAAAVRVGTADLQFVLPLHLLEAGQIDERGVQKVVGLTGQQLQREFLRPLPVPRLLRRDKRSHRVHAERNQCWVEEPRLSVWRIESVCEWQPRIAASVSMQVQTYVGVALKALPGDPLQLRHTRLQSRVDHRVNWFAEALVLESHAQSKFAKELHVGFALAQRLNRRLRDLQVIVAISLDQVFVLEESGGRQNQIGVVGGVGEELLVDHSKQVLALQPAPDQVLIGANGGWVRVVNHQGFDRRIVEIGRAHV